MICGVNLCQNLISVKLLILLAEIVVRYCGLIKMGKIF